MSSGGWVDAMEQNMEGWLTIEVFVVASLVAFLALALLLRTLMSPIKIVHDGAEYLRVRRGYFLAWGGVRVTDLDLEEILEDRVQMYLSDCRSTWPVFWPI